ncbi:hypothetical protein [Streptomyces sp. NBC_01538]|uniref:hypothetical protein n=1 Tax=Streptomyces sp. NBC_01538 TaxID=2903897 RepID=UPI00386C8667
MWFLIGLVFLGFISYGTVIFVRSATRRRASGRGAELAESGSTQLPCRISWKAGTGRKKFLYGKIAAGADGGLAFLRQWKDPVQLPRSDWVHREASWRAGLVNLRYAAPGQGEIRILLSEGDADTLERLLRGEG